MAGARVRIASICLIILFLTEAAAAQTRTVIAGKPFKLHAAYATNPDCSSAGDPVIRVTAPPANGSVSIGRGSAFPYFPESNPRSACNRRRVPATVATYVARRGYSGPDSVSIEVIYHTGQVRQGSYSLMVR
jgi:hypothetical protein